MSQDDNNEPPRERILVVDCSTAPLTDAIRLAMGEPGTHVVFLDVDCLGSMPRDDCRLVLDMLAGVDFPKVLVTLNNIVVTELHEATLTSTTLDKRGWTCTRCKTRTPWQFPNCKSCRKRR